MAVIATDESLHHTTTDLILPKPLRFYCAPMCSDHWQLRSLISSPRPNILFYPNGKKIIVLNTKTRESNLFTTLKFEPRCLTASNEWLCCGGEWGDYISIYFGDEKQSEVLFEQNLDSNARLPLDLDPVWGSIKVPTLCKDIRPLCELSKIVGVDVVNCITIWSPSDIYSERTYQDSVALVSNNDRTVSILRLSDSELIEKLTLPDCVNRSLISPDGEMLICVCDDPFLYIFRRKSRQINKKGRFNSSKKRYHWDLGGKVRLEGQQGADIPECKGSFAAAFSPSGRYLAVATQCGIISIFKNKDIYGPPVSVFTTSRPNPSGEGCIRAMEFCSGPFDLLVWTESKGRVGVADVRDLFISKQILKLDHDNLKDTEKVLIIDRFIDSPAVSQRSGIDSYRSIPDNSTLDPETVNHIQSRNWIQDVSNAPLLRNAQIWLFEQFASRQQRDTNTSRGDNITSSVWRNPVEVRHPTSISYSTNNLESGINSAPGISTSLREFLNQDRAPSFRSLIMERTRENDRLRQHDTEQENDLQSRSNVLSTYATLLSQATGAENFAEPGRRHNENDPAARLERLNISSSQGRRLHSEPLRDTTILLQQHNPANQLQSSDHSSSLLRNELEENNRGELENRMNELIDFALDAQRVFSAQRNRSQSDMVSIMGCCWSQDGKILYTATERGIYEYHVNIRHRKLFPRLAFC